MLVKQFPDINWLKAKIKDNFNDQRALNNVVLEHPGWPTILLNTTTNKAERKDIKGPFSLFLNRHGTSEVTINHRITKVNEHCFVLSNFGEHYDLLINEESPTETLNLHFGENFYFEALTTLQNSDEKLLDDWELCTDSFNLIPKTVYRDGQFNHSMEQLIQAYDQHSHSSIREEILFDILKQVLTQNSREIKRIQNLKVKKASTRLELTRRLYQARDFIHHNLSSDISLEELSRVSCLSKFHFLRAFKEVFRESPYQYVKRLRFEKAMELIRKTKNNLEDIADQVGIENASSLSRLVFQQTSHYPSYFRN